MDLPEPPIVHCYVLRLAASLERYPSVPSPKYWHTRVRLLQLGLLGQLVRKLLQCND